MSNFIIIPTEDSMKYRKNCTDFRCLKDGTLTGDERFCDRSFECEQTDFIKGKKVNMKVGLLIIKDDSTGKIIEHVPYCTGKYDFRPAQERIFDDMT